MLFKGTLESDNNAKSYWLASPGVIINSDRANFAQAVYIAALCTVATSYSALMATGLRLGVLCVP